MTVGICVFLILHSKCDGFDQRLKRFFTQKNTAFLYKSKMKREQIDTPFRKALFLFIYPLIVLHSDPSYYTCQYLIILFL